MAEDFNWEYGYKLNLSDDEGELEVRILKDLSQIQFNKSCEDFEDDVYLDTNLSELKQLRDFLDYVINFKS